MMATGMVRRIGGPVGLISVDVETRNLTPGDGSAYADYPVGAEPVDLATGDLNGDGALDIVTANNNVNANTVSVLLGTGAGTFSLRTDYSTGPAGSKPVAVATGDFNGDGNTDLAVLNSGDMGSGVVGNVAVMLGVGDGSFNSVNPIDVGDLGDGLSAIAVGDMDGDTDLDIVVANPTKMVITVLLNNGLGSFPVPADFGTTHPPVDLVLGFVDGDANLDVITVSAANNKLSLLLGTGNLPMLLPAAPDLVFAAGGTAPASVVLSDLNGRRPFGRGHRQQYIRKHQRPAGKRRGQRELRRRLCRSGQLWRRRGSRIRVGQ